MSPHTLENGDVVQLSKETSNPAFAHCMMTVTEVYDWGIQGYVQSAGVDGQQYYRAEWEHMEYVGKAVWVA